MAKDENQILQVNFISFFNGCGKFLNIKSQHEIGCLQKRLYDLQSIKVWLSTNRTTIIEWPKHLRLKQQHGKL